jgi:hypothetical protein
MSEKEKGRDVNIQFDKSQFGALMDALHGLVKVLAASQTRSEADTGRNARFLRAFGLSETEIGDILGMTQQAINKALKKSKKASKSVRIKKVRETAVASIKEA